jgi:hypothetical protein
MATDILRNELSISRLGVELLDLCGELMSIVTEFHFKNYYRIKDNFKSVKETEKEIFHRIGNFKKQSLIYENKLRYYTKEKLYVKEKNQDHFLSSYIKTRKELISAIRSFVRFALNEYDHEAFNELRSLIRGIINTTNFFINSVWAVVQDILSVQIIQNESQGIDIQKKYQLVTLDRGDITPKGIDFEDEGLRRLMTFLIDNE